MVVVYMRSEYDMCLFTHHLCIRISYVNFVEFIHTSTRTGIVDCGYCVNAIWQIFFFYKFFFFCWVFETWFSFISQKSIFACTTKFSILFYVCVLCTVYVVWQCLLRITNCIKRIFDEFHFSNIIYERVLAVES